MNTKLHCLPLSPPTVRCASLLRVDEIADGGKIDFSAMESADVQYQCVAANSRSSPVWNDDVRTYEVSAAVSSSALEGCDRCGRRGFSECCMLLVAALAKHH